MRIEAVRLSNVLLFGLAVAAAPLVHATEVYEWRDADGVEHMSDTPPPADQEGVVLVRVNGNEVNTFHDDPVADATEESKPTVDTKAARVPRDEEECAQIHGRACDWNEHWRRYAEAGCARVGDGYCHDDAHLRAYYDPRVHAERRRVHRAHAR
jgi:hypothetical protein